MWFPCKHRYTGNPICATPCINVENICLDSEDEKYCQEGRGSTHLIFALLMGFILAGCILGEITYKIDFHKFYRTKIEIENEDRNLLYDFVEQLYKRPVGSSQLELQFMRIHDENKVRNLIMLLDLKLKSYELVHAFQYIYRLELSLHVDNIMNAELCLKDALGTNEMAGKFMDYVEYGFFTRSKLEMLNRIQQMLIKLDIKITSLSVLLNLLGFIVNITFYYLDLIKDIFFVIFMNQIAKSSPSGAYESNVVIVLIFIITLNEVMKLIFTLCMRKYLNLSAKGLFFTIVMFPFLPAILIYITTRLAHLKFECNDLGRIDCINSKIYDIRQRWDRGGFLWGD